MFEVISGFMAIGFAWVMMAFIMFPVVSLGEYSLSRYLEYFTDGDVKLPKMVLRFWDRIADAPASEFGVVFMVIGYVFSFFVSFTATLVYFTRSDSPEWTWADMLSYSLFEFWVPIGEFFSPVLIVVGAVWGFTYVGRKSFKFKKVLVNHMNDKKKHNG